MKRRRLVDNSLRNMQSFFTVDPFSFGAGATILVGLGGAAARYGPGPPSIRSPLTAKPERGHGGQSSAARRHLILARSSWPVSGSEPKANRAPQTRAPGSTHAKPACGAGPADWHPPLMSMPNKESHNDS
jgi:hypothetical protein